MRRIAILLLAALAGVASAQYTSKGVRLLSHIALNQFPGSPSSGSAINGYTSASGREYATIGIRNGTAIVDITNPTAPVTIAHVPGPNSLWHENVVLGDYCYSVTEGGGGIQVIDLHNVDAGVATLVATWTGGNLNNVHTIEADPATKRLFANGTNNGFLILDASNPTALVELGRWTTNYVHDCVIRNYTSGPYAGQQIGFLHCGSAGIKIVNITNPGAAMPTTGALNYYQGVSTSFYSHSGSLSADNHYLFANDELDEYYHTASGCTTFVVDVSNLSAPTVASVFNSGVNTIDHNSALRNGYMFLSAYKSGVRVYNVSNPSSLSEAGFFDTYPGGEGSDSFNGDWGVFSNFASGNIVLSDIDGGLFVLDPTEAMGYGAPIVSSVLNETSIALKPTLIRESDNQYFTIPSGKNRLSLTCVTTMPVRNLVDVHLEVNGSGPFVLHAKNFRTGATDTLGTWTLNSTDQLLDVNNLVGTDYINASGQINLSISASRGSLGGPFTKFDQIRVLVH